MRKLTVVLLALTFLPSLAVAQDWKDVSLIDAQCSSKAKADPDSHTRACALQCQKAGFGILTAEGDFIKLDAAGNAKALKLLQGTKQADHLRVNVTGERSGDTIAVKDLKPAKS